MADINVNKKPLPVSESFFDSMIERGYYYVDKTLLIKDMLDKEAKVVLCTRPRRFGKTLNQTMLSSARFSAARSRTTRTCVWPC